MPAVGARAPGRGDGAYDRIVTGPAQGAESGGLLSSDSHVMEPPDLWSAAAPARFADLAPHVEIDRDADWWVLQGRRLFSFSVATKAGLRFEGQDRLTVDYRFSDIRPGSYLAHAHVTDNETDGVSGSVLYPSVATILFGLEDSEALSALARIYNDWIAGILPLGARTG